MGINPILRLPCLLLSCLTLVVSAAMADAEEILPDDALAAELRAVEIGFAKSMADRDAAAFAGFLADETVFFAGDKALRGKHAVAKAWGPFFEGEAAPFSWQPDVAVVLDSGGLGLTSGPVFDPEGKRIGTFNSVWRRGADGAWKIVFDRGCPDCACP
jgi:ketosteroid isomerase-like protein